MAKKAENKENSETIKNTPPRLSKSVVLGCRMPLDELQAIEQAAREAGETTTEYVRAAVALRRESKRSTSSVSSFSLGCEALNVTVSTVSTRASQGSVTHIYR